MDNESDEKTTVQVISEQNDSIAIKSTPINKKKKSQFRAPFVVISNDTVNIAEDGKVFGIVVNNDTIFSYKLFQAYEEETDFGKTLLCVRNKKFNLYWKKELDDYARTTYSNEYIIISDVNTPHVYFYDLITGKLKKKLKIEFIISDSNEFLADNKYLYISSHKENGELEKIISIQCGEQFEIKDLVIDFKGFCSLQKNDSNLIVLLNSNGEIVKQFDYDFVEY